MNLNSLRTFSKAVFYLAGFKFKLLTPTPVTNVTFLTTL